MVKFVLHFYFGNLTFLLGNQTLAAKIKILVALKASKTLHIFLLSKELLVWVAQYKTHFICPGMLGNC